MKKGFVFTLIMLIFLTVASSSCGKEREPMTRSQIDSLAKTYGCYSAIQIFMQPQTPSPYDKFSKLMLEESWNYLETLTYLDALPLVSSKIFISGYEHSQLDSLGNIFLTSEAKKAQDTLFSELKGILVGTECAYSTHELLTYDKLFEEQKDGIQVYVDLGLSTGIPNDASIHKSLNEWCQLDVSLQLMKSGSPVIGTEPRAIWLAQQYMLQHDGLKYGTCFKALDYARSEYALTSVVRWILENSYKEKIVLLYGKMHIPDFEFVYRKYGLVCQRL